MSNKSKHQLRVLVVSGGMFKEYAELKCLRTDDVTSLTFHFFQDPSVPVINEIDRLPKIFEQEDLWFLCCLCWPEVNQTNIILDNLKDNYNSFLNIWLQKIKSCGKHFVVLRSEIYSLISFPTIYNVYSIIKSCIPEAATSFVFMCNNKMRQKYFIVLNAL